MVFLPHGVQVGPATITYFSLIWIAAIVVTGVYSALRARSAGGDMGIVVDTLVWMSLASLVVARIFYIFSPPPSTSIFYDRQWYLAHPVDLQVGVLAIWSGGLGAAGALLGGLAAGTWHLSRSQINVWKWADIFAPAFLLGLAVVPWANIMNQQLYGPPTSLPWGISIAHPVLSYVSGTRFHPSPAYVSLWTLVCFTVILLLERRLTGKHGVLFLFSLASYMLGLFLADWIRLDVNHGLFGLTGIQWVAVGLILVCVFYLYRKQAFSLKGVSLTGSDE